MIAVFVLLDRQSPHEITKLHNPARTPCFCKVRHPRAESRTFRRRPSDAGGGYLEAPLSSSACDAQARTASKRRQRGQASRCGRGGREAAPSLSTPSDSPASTLRCSPRSRGPQRGRRQHGPRRVAASGSRGGHGGGGGWTRQAAFAFLNSCSNPSRRSSSPFCSRKRRSSLSLTGRPATPTISPGGAQRSKRKPTPVGARKGVTLERSAAALLAGEAWSTHFFSGALCLLNKLAANTVRRPSWPTGEGGGRGRPSFEAQAPSKAQEAGGHRKGSALGRRSGCGRARAFLRPSAGEKGRARCMGAFQPERQEPKWLRTTHTHTPLTTMVHKAIRHHSDFGVYLHVNRGSACISARVYPTCDGRRVFQVPKLHPEASTSPKSCQTEQCDLWTHPSPGCNNGRGAITGSRRHKSLGERGDMAPPHSGQNPPQ